VNPALAIAASVASAAGYGISSVLQHHSVTRLASEQRSRWSVLARLAARPLWLVGLGVAVAALALHVLALSLGQLSVVQPVRVTGLLFTLAVGVLIEHHRPSAAQWGWALLLTTGLALFLLIAHPSAGHTPLDTDRLLLVAIVVIAAVVLAAIILGRRATRVHRAALLGLAAGITNALTAALLKQTSALASHGFAAMLASWPLYAVLAVGPAALVLTQLAYHAGPLTACLPPMTLADPIVSIIIGALVFDEDLAHSPAAITGQSLGFALMSLAITQLARQAAETDPLHGVPAASGAAGTGPRP
jgi:drug/metabolite transporter (DMT)-like permease